MRILLPPSETKAIGGDQPSLTDSPIQDSLSSARVKVIDALIELCSDRDEAIKALKLGPKQHGDVESNLEIMTTGTMPALSRYTGVLFDALKAEGDLNANRLSVQSALFGLIPATTNIPYYRLSWDSKLPNLNLKSFWREAHADYLAHDEQILDMRSKSYQELAPLDPKNSWVVEVLVEYSNGTRKPLNHFNKKAKGVFARVASRENQETIDQVPEIAKAANQKAEVDGRVVTLIVPEGY